MRLFDIFGLLATPIGYVMQFLYNIIGNYGWTIVILTILLRLVMFPLTLKQQKSTARMSAFQPMIQEVQKKWANDKNRQQQEMQKLYEEHNIKMSAGCLPMLVNMLVLFGIIAVIQSPLNHVLRVDANEINVGYAIIQQHDPNSGIEKNNAAYTKQSYLIARIKDPETRHWFTDGADLPYYEGAVYVLTEGYSIKDGALLDKDGKAVNDNEGNPIKMEYNHTTMKADTVEKVEGFKFSWLGLNLADAPTFSLDKWYTLIMPVLSLLTMVASQLIIMKTSGQTQNKGQMMIMTVLFGALFAFYAFRVPAGFSLYYTMSNVVMTVQQIIVKRIYDPEKIREEILAEIEAKKKEKKQKKKVVVRESDGTVVDRELSEAELAKLRLAKARELDARRYGADAGEDDDEAQQSAAAKKARQLDEEKYGAQPAPDAGDMDDVEDAADAADDAEAADADTEKDAYKPGRRKRSKQKKEETSFADQEREGEEANDPAAKEDE